MAGPETNQTRPSKGVKRKFGDHAGMFALFQDFLTRAAYNDEDDGNKGDNRDEEDKDDEDGNVDISWIEHCVDQPAGTLSYRYPFMLTFCIRMRT